MFRGFGMFDDDPFFSAHREHMREMNRMMGGFGGFGFGSPFGMLEGPQDERRNRERGMVPRARYDPFQSMFENMNGMMTQMHRNFANMEANPDGYSFSSSQMMSYSNDGRNPPKYFEASSSTKRGPGGVKETQKTVRDSESGLHKMAVGHHIGDRGHVIEKSRNTKTDTEEQKQDFFGIEEEDASVFDREFKEKTRNFGRYNEISGGYNDHRRRQNGEPRSRATPALGHGNHHREREGREKHHAARERNHAEERKTKKEKKVKMVEPDSHL